jgi:tetratricopeptide (TPR) repeat protein
MKKKAAAKAKRYPAKRKKKKQVSKRAGRAAQIAKPVPKKPSLQDDPRFAQVVQNYQAGLKALQERKFERAKALLQKVVEGPSRELADRAAVHLNTCNQQLARTAKSFKTPEEQYDYAVSLTNVGQYDEARAQLEKLLKQSPKADYAWYGMAVLDCLTGKVEGALKNLEQAIKLNAASRYQARNDSDFENLFDDPRFTELLYPEAGVESAPPPPPERASGGRNARRR